ncbi:hypothetical protein [Sphingobacterium faecium]|uniref:hypothetical protein n=1 Tax=Sphingobacterium faecium TaxID=34087 RepID=UPI00320B9F36
MPWYSFNPIDTFPHDTADPNNYSLTGTTPPNCPSPKLNLCAIQASDNQGLPIITQSLRTQISNAVTNKVETTNVLLRPN